MEAKMNPAAAKEEQEKISFVKMEYFLYGVSEANRIIYVVGQYQSQLTIDAARAVTNDMQ